MSAYLRRLVARGRGTLPTVQPRVPARFEAWPEPPASPPPEDGFAPPPHVAPQEASALPRARESRFEPPGETGPRDRPRDAAAPKPAPAAVPPPPRRIAPGETAPAPAPAIGPAPAEPAPATHIAAMKPLPGTWEQRGVSDEREPAARFAPVRVTPRRAQERGEAREEAEPVVHVTIGRIDVRAVAAPAAPAPPRRAAAPDQPLVSWLARRARP